MPLSGSDPRTKQLDIELNGGCSLKGQMWPQATGRYRTDAQAVGQ